MSQQSKIVKKKQGMWQWFLGSFYRRKPFDRRKDSRYKVYPPFFCTFSYVLEGEQLSCLSEIIDISKGGILAITGKNKIYPGTKLQIIFKLPSQEHNFTINAEIIRTYRLHSCDWYYSGLKFLERENNAIPQLIEYIMKEEEKLNNRGNSG